MTSFETKVLGFMGLNAVLSSAILAVALNTGFAIKDFIHDLSLTDLDAAPITLSVSAVNP